MKNERLAKNVQMILIAIFVVVIGIIVVALLLNNRVSAAIATCRACGGTNVSVSSTGDTSHTITCLDSSCDGYNISVSQVHNLGSSGKCSICGYQCPHSSHDTNGNCTKCGAQCSHSYSNGKCTICGKDCAHSYSSIGWSTTATTHAKKYKCSACGVGYTGSASEHTPTHENNGKCTQCSYQCETHSMSEEIVDYEKTETGHTPMYGCTLEGCDGTYTGDEETAHEGATHENEGKCTVCEYQYEPHTMSEEVLDYEKTETGHTPIYGCTIEGCEGTHKEEEQPHEGASHENEGKCTVCEYQYQIHSMSETIVDYEKTETGHTPVYGCTQEGCDETYTGDAEVAHEGVTHENEGKCAVCEYQCEIHIKSEEIIDYEKTEAGHTPIYGCTFEGCEGRYTGDEETAHEGATHENEGKCTVCEYQYQIHGVAEEQIEYEKTETSHMPIYGCTFEGCEGTHKGEEENHTGATHENEGKCKVCEYQYQIHSMSDEIVDYEKTETGHTPRYGCTLEGCEGEYTGDEETAHEGATHENEGKCTICEYQYQIHGVSEEQAGYEKTETGHIKLYKCTFEGCEGVHKVGTEEPHNIEEWIDEENGVHSGECTECGQKVTEEHDYGEDGKCKDCGARILAEECEHAYEIQKNETHHWKYCPKCETTEQGSFEPHKYGEYTKNEDGTHSATCTVCESELTEKHNYEIKNDETYHWEFCPKCETIKEGSKEKHTYEKYVDNGDGTHSAICTKCEYKLTEKHNYEDDGKCEDCEKRVPADECNHNYEMKNDDRYHWKFCPICETIKEGSKEKHTYEEYVDNGNGTHSSICTICEYKLTEKHDKDENGKCSDCKATEKKDEDKENNNNINNDNSNINNNNDNNNNTDNTTSDKEIPKAGSQSATMIVIIALVTVLGVSIFKIKKYKDI